MPAREGEQLGVDLSLGGGSDAAAGPRLPKRARPPGGGGASCAVEGCDADLSGCREYHRRHKVCEAHSKTPVVLVAGQEQRFCQQCSRFHLLLEFDEGKRSCRKRLDGHNRRRRKPQPDPSNFGNFFPLYEGPRFSPSRHMVPTPVLAPSWSSILEDKQSIDRHLQPFQLVERQQDITSRFHIYNEGKQAPCLHDVSVPVSNGVTLLDSALQQQRDISSSKLYIIQDEFSSGATQIVNSDCALSLLSSPTQIQGTHLGNMASASHAEFRQPIAQSIHQLDDLGRYSESQASASVLPIGLSFSSIDGKMVRTIMDSNGSNILNLRCQDAYNIEDGLSSGHTEALPFSWQ